MSIETTGRESGRLLLVDDGRVLALKRLFYRITMCAGNGGEEALSILETDSFDIGR